MGILEIDATVDDNGYASEPAGAREWRFSGTTGWKATREEAIAEARKMQTKRLVALKRQIAKLEKKVFE